MSKKRTIFNLVIALVIALIFYLVKYPFSSTEGTAKEVGITDASGNRQGLWKGYNEDGDLIYEYNYLNNKLHGVAKAYFDNGNLYTHSHHIHGHFVDTFYHYFKNGNINNFHYYDSSGVSQGEFKVFFESGELKQVGYKLNGKFHGPLIQFNQQGDTIKAEFFVLGKKEGI